MATLVRSISQSGGVLCAAIDSTDIAAKAEQIHETSATVTAALGRLLTAASLMGVMLKSEENSITVRLQGGGPAGLLIAVTDGLGNVRGDVENPIVEIPLNGDTIQPTSIHFNNRYTSVSGNQTFEVALRMRYQAAAFYVLSGVLQFIGLAVIYNLDRKTMAKMQADLAARKAN